MFDLMSTGDWLYMLFMHQACVYKTKHQYVKSNEILTTVFKEAYQNDCVSDILKEGIEAFQVKINLKQEYLAYYRRKNIHNCYNAMTTSLLLLSPSIVTSSTRQNHQHSIIPAGHY
jgi:hypothetical protein